MPKTTKSGRPIESELPDTLKRSPAKAQRQFAKTHDAAAEQYGEGERAHRTAYASLKHNFEKVGDHWEPKDRARPERPALEEDDRAEAARRGRDFRRRRRRGEHEGRALRACETPRRRGPVTDVEDRARPRDRTEAVES